LTSPLSHRATKSFWRLYSELPEDIRDLADKNFVLLRSDPFHPSLHFKTIKPELWSARVGMHFRALAIPENGGYAWIWIGSHAEYDRLIR
jgi:hypothetical protein